MSPDVGNTSDEIDVFAACLVRDLQTAGPRCSVIAPVPPDTAIFRRAAAAHGLDWPEEVDKAISLRVDGQEEMRLVFYRGQSHVQQLENLLDQVQTLVIETKRTLWPKCPAHNHFLAPRESGDWIQWLCPDTGESIARFGALPPIDGEAVE